MNLAIQRKDFFKVIGNSYFSKNTAVASGNSTLPKK
jgi:hypothetical protein